MPEFSGASPFGPNFDPSKYLAQDPTSGAVSMVCPASPTSVPPLKPCKIAAGIAITTNEVQASDVPDLGKGPDGRYGDERDGKTGAVKDLIDLPYYLQVPLNPLDPGATARRVMLRLAEDGWYKPDPDSRLGAFVATQAYPEGTLGYAIHIAIGTLYMELGQYGQEKIGRVFNSDEARALYSQPVDSDASRQMAEIEFRYWQNVANEDPWSAGGKMGVLFSPEKRDAIQRGFPHLPPLW